MMDVLLANVRLWSGRMNESVARGREAISLFQEIGDRWGEVMATGPVVRALAELGRDGEYADTLAHYRSISRDMPDEGMRNFPEVMESLVDLQQGRPDAAQAILENLDIGEAATSTSPKTVPRCRSGAGSHSRTQPRSAPTPPTQ